jgi:hypothetical protein
LALGKHREDNCHERSKPIEISLHYVGLNVLKADVGAKGNARLRAVFDVAYQKVT